MITFLGNVIDSVSMTVTLPKEKVDRIEDECLRLQTKNKTSIREVSRIIGILVSSFSPVDYGNLHYRILEKENKASVVIDCLHFHDQLLSFDCVYYLTPILILISCY
jgi:hypothetical protein